MCIDLSSVLIMTMSMIFEMNRKFIEKKEQKTGHLNHVID